MTARIPNWVLQLLGFDTDGVPDGAELQPTFTNLPQSWQVFVLIAAVLGLGYVVAMLYWKEIDTCSKRVKVVLAALRTAVLLVLLAVFLGPAATFTQTRVIPAQILVLRDTSQSMSTSDTYFDDGDAEAVASVLDTSKDEVRRSQPVRAAVVDRLFAADSGNLIAELKKHGRVSVADFSSNLKRHDPIANGPPQRKPDHAGEEPARVNGNPPPASVADGQATDLHRAVTEALAEKQLAAIVLFTDGQHTESDDPLKAAQRAKELGVPLFIVGIGDPTPRKNLEISEIYADRQVFKGAEFEVQALLRAEGYGGEDVEVAFTESRVSPNDGTPGEPVEIATKTVRIPPGGGQVRLAFSRSVDIPGRRRYSMTVKPRPDELSQTDNSPRDPVEVNILENQARVLLIAGGPSWEYRGVQRLLQNDDSVNLSCWMQYNDPNRAQDGNTIITRLPETEEQWLTYDVVLLFDPNPRDFDEKNVAVLKKFVDQKARGFMFLAGSKFSGQFLADKPTSELAELLPVTFGDVEVSLSTRTREWPLGIVAANVDQPIMRFYANPRETMKLWKSLRGIFWSFPAKSPKPGARVLIEHTDPALREVEGSRPLLVTRRYGAGRTVYLGFNGTWRWRSVGYDSEFFRRFWIQTVRYLIEGRLIESKGRGYVTSDKKSYQRGDTVTVTAELNDAQSKPLALAQIAAALTVDGKPAEPIVLEAVPNQPGYYQATLTARQLGRHELAVKLPDDPSAEPSVTGGFSVLFPSAELRDLRLNKATLQEMAALSGGKYYDVDDSLQIAAGIPDRTRTLRVEGKPQPLWDTALLLGVLVVLLSVEWGVRKYHKLL
ncbi:MAG: VWA domain-containing protein [Planctomycetaceae bacterium]